MRNDLHSWLQDNNDDSTHNSNNSNNNDNNIEAVYSDCDIILVINCVPANS